MPTNTPSLPVGLGTRPLALPGDAAIGDELERAGLAFGDLVQGVGQAVASTQQELNETGAALATTLAETVVDVIAVQELQYDENGKLKSPTTTHTRPLPLISFVDPVFYQWRYVRLQGQFFASEFAGATTASSSSAMSSSNYGQTGLGYVLGVGYNANTSRYSSSTTNTDTTSDMSFGSVRMNAMLEPRTDVKVPPPRQSYTGPSITVLAGEIEDVTESGAVVARTMNVTLELRRQNGNAIAGKALSVETSGVPWEFVGAGTTSAQGRLEIQLRREFPTPETDRAPTQVIVTARLGMVSTDATVTF